MLPHIHTENRNLILPYDILILGSHNNQRAGSPLPHKPSPSTTLYTQQLLVELLLEGLQIPPLLADGILQLRGGVWGRFRALLGSEVGPEEGVVDVASGIELDGGLQGHNGREVGYLGCFGVGVEDLIQVCDVGVVVLAVVQLHDGGRDGRFKSLVESTHYSWGGGCIIEEGTRAYIVLVRKRGEGVSLGHFEQDN